MEQKGAPKAQKPILEQKYSGTLPAALALGGGMLGFFLRLYMHRRCFDEWGLLHRGCAVHLVLIVLSVGILGALLFLCRGMGSDPRFRRNYGASSAGGILLFLAIPCFMAYGILGLGAEEETTVRLTAMLSFFLIPVLAGMGLARWEGKPCAFLFPLGGCLFLIVRLICRFRSWSMDPVIADYTPAMLANVMAMLAAFHTSGFSLGQGARRRSLFFCLGALYFSLLSLADGGSALALNLGAIFWMLGVLPRLAKPQTRRRPGGQPSDPSPHSEEPTS